MFGLSKRQINWLIVLLALFIGSISSWIEARGKGDNSGYTLMVFSLGILVAYVSFLVLRARQAGKSALQSLSKQDALLQAMESGNFENGDFVFATRTDEVVIARVSQTMLKEYKSTGSTRSGGYGGVSFPVFGRVRGNVGRYSGSTTKNPEESTPIDVGTSTYTNQRIVFAGPNVVREFDLSKLVNLESGDNGITVTIAVSNRDKASELASVNFDDLTPGIAASIAVAYHEGGKTEAIEKIKETRDQIQDVLALEQAKRSGKK
jgi:hypothetical protein